MTDTKNIRDVVVIGRGFAGLSLAVELAQSGMVNVEIIHDDADLLEASKAAHGIATIKGIFEADSELFSKKIDGHLGFNKWLQDLESLVGAERPASAWRLGVSESFTTAADFRKDFGRIYRRDFVGLKNVKIDFTTKGQFASAFYPADFWIDPQYLLDLLVAASKHLGIVITRDRVLKIKPAEGYSELLLKSAKTMTARCTVICAGAGTANLIAGNGSEVLGPMFAVPGSTFKGKSEPNEFCEVKGTSGVISFGENIHWGSTSELARSLTTDMSSTKPPTVAEQIDSGKKLLTKLGRHKADSTSIRPFWGVRVRTRKRDPFVACADPRANIWVSTGFYKSGITLCWLLSRNVVSRVLESVTISARRATSSR